ncbi:related to seed imbibition protein Sip1 [Cephalotrichum gorgonifer]|uniref:Related to seed imbibition protein Sip1 n=1 Tax=Cephalotrichum gorgonifer TaxID=2041049 RepID=A0AAE8MYV0_9PEZI|nr:related to seed imbibition protein Sip1 [Cephalotrichum gorgonifer]
MSPQERYAPDRAAVAQARHQNPPLAPLPEDMAVVAATYPPLGQVSLVPTQDTTFTVLLEVPSSRAHEPWQVALWHSVDSSEWSETVGSPLSKEKVPLSLQEEKPSTTTRLYFSVKLAVIGVCSFTLKFRSNQDESWRWVRDETGMNDGTIIVPVSSVTNPYSDLADIVKDLNVEWTVVPRQSQAPKTQLWSLDVIVASARGEVSTEDVIPLGLPWGTFLRWFSLARITQPWIAPVHGSTRFDLALDGIVCSFLNPEGQHLVILAVSGIRNVMTALQADESGNVVVRVRNDSATNEKATVLVSVGDDFSRAMAAVMYHARSLVSAPGAQNEALTADLAALTADTQPQWRENWYDGLGYCTWNSLGQDLSDQKLFHALEGLAALNINISNLIIDDNWQSIERHGDGQADWRWLGFEAEPKHFPMGLKGTVGHIREKYPHIKHVAVWHALFGYWGGISPEGKIAKEYRTVDIHRRYNLGRDHRPGGPITTVAAEDVGRFFDDFYRFLFSCGVDGVKTDAQFILDTLTSAEARRGLTNPYLDAWNIATLRHFGTHAISCMSLTPHIIFHGHLPRGRPAFLCRNSDDYYPPDPAAHPWHVWVNAYNSVFTRYLNAVPDWDMFQTVHEYAAFHAAARCISGGPIYISDVPGEHDVALIRQMTATTIRGQTVILRPSVQARAMDSYVAYEDDVLLKVDSYNGPSKTGTPILGIFNTSPRPLTELIHLSSLPGIVGPEYIVTSHTSGTVTGPLDPGDYSALLTLSLDIRGYEILTAHPLTALGATRVANLGLRGKMTGAVAISSSTISETGHNRVLLNTSLKALGVLGVYISHLPSLSIADDFIATISGQVIPPATVSVSSQSDYVIEIDLEQAWKETEPPVGWGNEVDVKVYFTLQK